jgi:hypothetical protein
MKPRPWLKNNSNIGSSCSFKTEWKYQLQKLLGLMAGIDAQLFKFHSVCYSPYGLGDIHGKTLLR